MAKAAKKAPVKKAAKKVEKPPATKKVAPKPKPEVKPLVEEKAAAPVEQPQEEKAVECPEPELGSTEFDEMTIKEIMVQKNVSRIEAIDILRNPK